MGFLPNTDKRPNRKDEIASHICAELLPGRAIEQM